LYLIILSFYNDFPTSKLLRMALSNYQSLTHYPFIGYCNSITSIIPMNSLCK
jgi:hypothetical protein